MMSRFCIISILILSTLSAFSQEKKNEDYLPWSASRRLTADDFHIRKGAATSSSFAQFSMGYSVQGFDVFRKNFNNRIFNHFVRSASWIDTTSDIHLSLKYQQTLFDLSEIYARQFRKLLKDNKKKILTGINFVHELDAQIMGQFAKRRLQYDEETNFGTNADKQKAWEEQILKELEELKEFELIAK